MHRPQSLIALFLFTTLTAAAVDFSGASALEFTRQAVAFGPRPPGSPAIRKLQAHIIAQLRKYKCEVIEDDFTGNTPIGPVPMKNIIAKIPGSSGRAVVFTGHYDTARPFKNFVGANDGGASAGFLLELGRVLNGAPRKDTVYLVWFDGEEAIERWSETDGIHGSRHLADKWSRDGTLGRIKALINVDMIGDKDLNILTEFGSSQRLRGLIWQVAEERGYGRYFLKQGSAVEDDHMPFVRKGVNAVDLIDFDYGPNNAYWHNEKDTMDKLGAHSFQVVGDVLVEVLRRLEQQ